MFAPKHRLAIAAALCTLLLVALAPVAAQAQALVWAKSFGGTAADRGTSIAVDGAGNVYTTGFFSDTADFDPGAGVSNLVSAGSEDVFVTKLDSAGSLVWARSMGGASQDIGLEIAVDGAGNVYTTGYFNGTADFDPSAGVLNLAGSFDVFVSKLSSSGNLVWAKSFGGSGFDQGLGIAVDGTGNVHVAGAYVDTVDFDPDAGVSNLTSAGQTDVFVSKLDASGSLIWVRSWGDAGSDFGEDLALDSAGNVHTTGLFQGTVDFDPGAGVTNLATSGPMDSDAYVSKLDSSGALVWARAMGGTSFEDGRDIAVDSSGNVYTTGNFAGTTDFDPGPGSLNFTTNGASDLFVSKLSQSGNLVWARAMGGFGSDVGWGVAVDAGGNPHIAGSFEGSFDFDPGPFTTTLNSAGASDVFVLRLDSSGSLAWARAMGGPSFDEGFGIAVNSAAATVHTTGLFYDTADFDPGPGIFNLVSAGSEDAFVSKLGPGAALSIDKQCTDQALPGASVSCSITLGNTVRTATGVVVTDLLPAQLTLVPGSLIASGGFSCGSSGQTITCTKASVPVAGAVTVVTFTATLDSSLQPGATVANLAGASGSNTSQVTDTEVIAVPGCTITGSGNLSGTPADDVICGSPSGDSINGQAGNDVVFGGGGNDNLQGGAGNDSLLGGAGNDNLSGGDGDDRIFGGTGNDTMSGNDGGDLLVGEAGNDLASGGAGTDSCSAETTTGCP